MPSRGFSPCSTYQETRSARGSKLQMQTHAGDKHGPAIFVVAGMADILRVERRKYSSPHMHAVVSFQNVLACVVQVAVSQHKPGAAQGQILLMVARDSVGDEREPRAVKRSMPAQPF